MFYLKGWCYRCGLAQPGEVQTPAETMVSRTSLVLVRPTLASALVHLGFPRCFAVHLPNSIGAGNRTLWRELLFKGMLEGFQQLVAFRATFSFSFHFHFIFIFIFHFQFHFHFNFISFHYIGTTKTKNLHFSKECWVMPGKSHPAPGRCFPALGQILRYTCAFAERN